MDETRIRADILIEVDLPKGELDELKAHIEELAAPAGATVTIDGRLYPAADALHPTVRHTDELRASAEALRDLGSDVITASDDPLTVVRNLYAALDALKDAWPAISQSAGFEDPFGEDSCEFTEDIRRGFQLAVDGLWNASNSI